MYWTLELASKLEDAPWPATKDELIDYAVRSGAPLEVLENLQERILACARVLLLEQGIDGLNIRAVASACGVAVGMVV